MAEAAGAGALDELHQFLDKGGLGPDILHRRMSPLSGPSTLADVGAAHNITRERVRQVQVRIEKLIDAAADEPGVLETAGRFRDHFGPAVPLDSSPSQSVSQPFADQGSRAGRAVP